MCNIVGGERERERERLRERMKYNQVIRLNSGATIPIMGFGTYSAQNDREETKQAVQMALKVCTKKHHLLLYF